MPLDKVILRQLKNFKGEVYNDELSIGIYATDASVYMIKPMAVVVPKDNEDVVLAHQVAFANNLPILPRGAGTSLAGQAVAHAIVIDFSRHMTNILEINPEQKTARVQPGVIHQSLNRALKEYGLLYGPDPATSSRANMGGIIANNSSGSHSIVYGKAVDHIVSMKVALDDGTVLTFKDESLESVARKSNEPTREGMIYKELLSIIHQHQELIIDGYPKVMRRVTGYNLDEFATKDVWNLGQLICGSEGTLGTILEVTVSLDELPPNKAVCVVHFDDRMKAIAAVHSILDFGPAAVELLDKSVIDLALTNPATKKISGFIEGRPDGLLIVEFYGDSPHELDEKHQVLETFLREQGMGYAYPFFHQRSDNATFQNIWEVRKQGLGLLLSIREDAKPQPFIEDACVPVPVLAEYIQKVVDFCESLDTQLILYAHASVGVLHVRPILDLRQKEDIEKFKTISAKVLEFVKYYGGSWSGEHGDGLVRSPRIPDFYGEEIYGDFVRVKKVFDPKGILNPGKIVDAEPMDHHLRYGVDYKEQEVDTVFHYRKELSFSSLANMCNGIGVCQRTEGGVMCPSYKASRHEMDSTRARANALRLTLSGELGQGDFTSDELETVLDLCVSCKSCKTECPSNVDIAKMKSEVTQKRYDKHGLGMREKLILKSDAFAKTFSGWAAGLVNWGQSLWIFRRVLESVAKIDARRKLPQYAHFSLTKWYRKNYRPTDKPSVVLFADTYINYHEPQIGIAIIRLLSKMGFHVQLVDVGGSKRPLISNGFLRKAKEHGELLVQKLMPYLDKNLPIIVCEPSAYSALKEDIPDLIDNEKDGKKLSQNTISLEHFVADWLDDHPNTPKFRSKLAAHYLFGHCHTKALEGMEYLETIFKNVDGNYTIIDAGCCGMAGAFGFEKEHYDFSKQIFDNDLGPKLQAIPKSATVLATGFSCRGQIDDFGAQDVKHWVEILDV
ncbi:MAG TPA: FAD-binding oxidoreductase [Saprospiraceae bacterium]|nr:FAD-binding oxidoreductase [Saprospiraceae bacterium]